MVATVATIGTGCGVDEQVHNAALKDRDAQKQKLAETQSAPGQGEGGRTRRTSMRATRASWC